MKRKIVRRVKPARTASRKSTGKPARRRAPAAATTANDAIETLVAANAEPLGLTIDPAWRAGVSFNLRLLFTHAARVDEFPLPDDIEPAPVFRA